MSWVYMGLDDCAREHVRVSGRTLTSTSEMPTAYTPAAGLVPCAAPLGGARAHGPPNRATCHTYVGPLDLLVMTAVSCQPDVVHINGRVSPIWWSSIVQVSVNYRRHIGDIRRHIDDQISSTWPFLIGVGVHTDADKGFLNACYFVQYR